MKKQPNVKPEGLQRPEPPPAPPKVKIYDPIRDQLWADVYKHFITDGQSIIQATYMSDAAVESYNKRNRS